MEVTGYKEIAIGFLPEDWNIVPFSKVVLLLIDYRGVTPKKLGFTWGGGDILALSANNVEPGKINPDKEAYYGSTSLYKRWMRQGDCALGDIVMTMEAPLGNVAQIPDSKKYILSQRVVLIKTKGSLDPYFLAHFMRGSFFQNQLSQNSSGTTAQGIQSKKLRRIDIHLPSTKAEQQAIAEALSEMDATIEALEELILKKRLIKQGTMQELLTGKLRLPGFSKEWIKKSLKEIADIRSGGTPSTTQYLFWDGIILWCTPTDITALQGKKYLSTTKRHISNLGLKSSSAEIIPANSVVMTSRATIGECAINRVPVTTNQGFKNFVPYSSTDVHFLYYLLIIQKQGFISLCGGSTFLEISKAQLANYEVFIPSNKNEQAAISNILSDIDLELETLESKLTKTRELKQGMMQQLLTGKIRLI